MGIASKALHFGLGSLGLFADVGKFNAIGAIGNAVLDVCDAERDAAIHEAVEKVQAVHERQLKKLNRKHKRQLERLKDRALEKLAKAEEDTQYVLKCYRRDVRELMRKAKSS